MPDFAGAFTNVAVFAGILAAVLVVAAICVFLFICFGGKS